jgi:hypothetical protein
MSYLYKRCNWLWPTLIRHRLVSIAWRPLVELNRRRHLRFRARLATDANPTIALPVLDPAAHVGQPAWAG